MSSRLLTAGTLVLLLAASMFTMVAQTTGEWRLTYGAINHLLDNNDNFSRDDRFLCFDTRDTVGSGIGQSTTIGKVSVTTGLENLIYAPYPIVLAASGSAPGVGAASYSPVADDIVFIHGPLVSETAALGFYGTTNRRAGVVSGDGSGDIRFLEMRDVTSAATTPGAHRGGTHRHEYTLDGKRIGFTYDDFLMTTHGRTIGMMVPHENAPGGATHWSVLLVRVVPTASAVAGDLVKADSDSWIGSKGLMRGFIGQVKEADGSLMSSLFVVDIPENVDVTTANAGTATSYPVPPAGVTIRRLTHTAASGIVRGSHDGTRIAYRAKAADGTTQVFIIPSNGSDQAADPALRPVQATFLEKGASGGLRWHPSGNSIAVLSDGGLVAVSVAPGPTFGKAVFLTEHGSGVTAAEAPVWSRDGLRLAFNRRVPTWDANGAEVKDFRGRDFQQIFLVNFPDQNANGIPDTVE